MGTNLFHYFKPGFVLVLHLRIFFSVPFGSFLISRNFSSVYVFILYLSVLPSEWIPEFCRAVYSPACAMFPQSDMDLTRAMMLVTSSSSSPSPPLWELNKHLLWATLVQATLNTLITPRDKFHYDSHSKDNETQSGDSYQLRETQLLSDTAGIQTLFLRPRNLRFNPYSTLLSWVPFCCVWFVPPEALNNKEMLKWLHSVPLN